MLEVLFSDSAAGSMAVAMSCKDCIGEEVSVMIGRDGLSDTELQKLQQQAQERHRQNWAEAVPLNGTRDSILSFSLAFSVGEIQEDGIGPQRQSAVESLMAVFPEIAREVAKSLLDSARKSYDTLLKRAQKGEPIRVWSSENPDEACGLYWLMEQLRPLGFENLQVTLVKLPDFAECSDHSVVRYLGWGDVEPHQWGQMALQGVRLPANCMRAMANHWKRLQSENAPLRAVVGAQLVSMPENLYDSFILRELQRQPREFMEAQVVGSVLGKYQLGIGDAWVALRIEQFIKDGLLEIVTQPKKEAPIYHRYLRKTSKLS